jgi:LuxR family maltose regulon positive regulatory protein
VEAATAADLDRFLTRAKRPGSRVSTSFTNVMLHTLARGAAPASGSPPLPAQGALIEPLTRAELDLLPMLATELTYAEIAASRFVSVNTVKSQMQSIYRKLGVTSRIAAIEHSRALGLADRSPAVRQDHEIG